MICAACGKEFGGCDVPVTRIPTYMVCEPCIVAAARLEYLYAFYGVRSKDDLIKAQDEHINKMVQQKLNEETKS